MLNYDLEGPQKLDSSASLMVKAQLAQTEAEINDLIFSTEGAIKELFSVSYPKQPNPAVYKELNDALKILNEKSLSYSTKTAFSFKSFKSKPPVKREIKIPHPEPTKEDPTTRPEFEYNENCTIKDHKSKRFFRTSRTSKMGYANIENLNNCEVVLLNVFESSFVYNVKNSTIWISIANSSLMLDNIEDSVIVTCSRQLRVSNSKNVRFFVDTVTPPIIETSTNMSFSSNHLRYPGFDEHLETSDLKGNLLESQEMVKDFSWHHSSKSPNWETTAKKPEHITTIIQLNSQGGTNSESLADFDWQILKSL